MPGNAFCESLRSSPAALDTKSSSKLYSCCSPITELRTYKEEKPRAEKPADVGRWTHTNQRPSIICPKSEVFDSSFSPSPNARPMFERRQSLSQTKQRRHKLAKPKISITEKSLADIMEESVDVENDVVTEDLGGFIYFSQLPDVGQKDDISALKRDGLHIHRCRLEKEVERLRATLQQEQEINFAFETALRSKPRAISDFGHLPINAQELLADIAMLEAAISSLEEQITLLLSHLGRECSQHQILETFDGKLSFNMSPVQQLLKTLSISTL